jgi:hypothetical protein
MSTVAAALDALVSRAEQVVPGMRGSLRQGASDSYLDELANMLGPWPAELRDLLRAHDGQDIRFTVFDLESLASAQQIVETWTVLAEVENPSPSWWSAAWVPLTSSDGHGFHVHRDTGEVRYYENYHGLHESPRFASITALFDAATERLVSGRFELEETTLWLRLSPLSARPC